MSVVRASVNVAINVVMPCRHSGHNGLAGSSDMAQLLRVLRSESAVRVPKILNTSFPEILITCW